MIAAVPTGILDASKTIDWRTAILPVPIQSRINQIRTRSDTSEAVNYL